MSKVAIIGTGMEQCKTAMLTQKASFDSYIAAMEDLSRTDLSYVRPFTHKTAIRINEGTMPYTRPKPKIGRNAPCPCGSGRKHKRCCGQ